MTRVSLTFQTTDLANYYASTLGGQLELRIQIPINNQQTVVSLQSDDSNNYATLQFQTPAEWRNFVRAMVAIDYSLGNYLNAEKNNPVPTPTLEAN